MQYVLGSLYWLSFAYEISWVITLLITTLVWHVPRVQWNEHHFNLWLPSVLMWFWLNFRSHMVAIELQHIYFHYGITMAIIRNWLTVCRNVFPNIFKSGFCFPVCLVISIDWLITTLLPFPTNLVYTLKRNSVTPKTLFTFYTYEREPVLYLLERPNIYMTLSTSLICLWYIICSTPIGLSFVTRLSYCRSFQTVQMSVNCTNLISLYDKRCYK